MGERVAEGDIDGDPLLESTPLPLLESDAVGDCEGDALTVGETV